MMKLLVCALAVWCFAQVKADPSVVFQCIRSDYTDNQGKYATGAMNLHLRVDAQSAAPMYIYSIDDSNLDVADCHFDGSGTTLDPWDLKVTVDISLTFDTYTGEYCGLRVEAQTDYSGQDSETDYFMVWIIRIRRSASLLSKSDFLYKISCDTTNAPSDFQYSYPISATDITEVELNQVVCVPNLRVLSNDQITFAVALGDLVKVEGYAVCTDTNALTPTGIFFTQLQVSNTEDFADYIEIIDAYGCPIDVEAFQADTCRGSSAASSFFSEIWYSCGLLEIFSFAKPPQLILYFRALLDFCYDRKDDMCKMGACSRVPGGPVRKKRETQEGHTKPKLEDIGVMVLPFGTPSSQAQTTCVESNIFIAVFAVMCALLLVVSAASVYLVLKLNKRSRNEIERLSNIQMGKVNPAF